MPSVGDWSFAALPAPVLRHLADLGAGSLLAASAFVSLMLVLVAVHYAPRFGWRMVGRSRSRTVASLAAVALFAAVAFAGSFVAGHTVRALARDVSEDRHESAARLPVGSRVGRDGPPREALVWAVGDGPDGGAAARAVGRLVTSDNPDRILYLGDVYGPYAEEVRGTFDGATGRVSATPGNHDWPKSAAEYLHFWSRSGLSASQYYSFRIAGWQVLSLNSEVPHGAGSAQLAWVRREVAPPGDCRIAFYHRPRYSAGRHGDQPDIEPVWRALTGKAALVLNGHDHDMQRLAPVDGTTEMVVGSGGHGHYQLHPSPRVVFGDDRHYGALRLQLSPGKADYEFVSANGRVLDHGDLTCSTAHLKA